MNKPNYWVLLKNGELRVRQTAPETMVYVIEIVLHVSPQITQHELIFWDEHKTITCYNDYDRMVKRLDVIKRMMTE